MNVHNIKDNRYYLFKNSGGDAIAVMDVENWSTAFRNTRFGDEQALLYLNESYRVIPISLEEKETYCDVFNIVVLYDIYDTATYFFDKASATSYEPWYWEFDKRMGNA